MAQVLVSDSNLTAIANAIRSKAGGSAAYKPGQMATAINGIATASSVTLTTKTVTANGTYSASSDNASGYSSVTVNIPSYDSEAF